MHPGYQYQTATQLLDINTKRLVYPHFPCKIQTHAEKLKIFLKWQGVSSVCKLSKLNYYVVFISLFLILLDLIINEVYDKDIRRCVYGT